MANLTGETVFERQEQLAVQIADAKTVIDSVNTKINVLMGLLSADLVASLAQLPILLNALQDDLNAISTDVQFGGKPLISI